MAPDAAPLFGAEGHVWSAGTMAAFAGLDLTGTPARSPLGLILRGKEVQARLRPGGRLLAFETLSSDPTGWNHGLAICLPLGEGAPLRMLRRVSDSDAIERVDRGRLALDLGLAQGPSRALFRPDDPAGFATEGREWPEAAPALEPLSGVWIIDTPVLRIERRLPRGIGIHTVAQALASGATHAVTTPVPAGLVPVAHVFPPHPGRLAPGAPAPFDTARHQQFQSLLERFGRPDLWALKQQVSAQLAEGRFDPPEVDRHGAAVVRVALRQHARLHGAPPQAWLARFDRPLLRALAGEG